MSNRTCGECQLNGVDCRCEANEKACEEFEPKPITNGDKIRQMSNAKLAEFMLSVVDKICEKYCVRPCMFCSDCCEQAVLAWLDQEAKDE